jgi:histidinol-phosphate aminotransferase
MEALVETSKAAEPAELLVASYIRSLAPYVGGKPIEEVAREFGLDPARIVKLASNENPLGIPESAQRAILKTMGDLARYPDGNGFELKTALAAQYDVPLDWITLGNGSNDILELAAQAFLQTDGGASSSVVYSQYAFVVYELAGTAYGARLLPVPAAKGYGHDLAAMAAAIEDDTRLVFIANPNNPTGTFAPPYEIEAFLKSAPARVVVVLDEAYNEYLEPEIRFDSTEWVRRFPNLLVVRTFSKAYGLAGLRIGYSLAQPPITDVLNRIRRPFNVNSLALSAATAALADLEFLGRSYQVNRAGVAQLSKAFDDLGLEQVPSFANFVLVKVGEDRDAGPRVYVELLKRGIIVRPVANYGLLQWLRISVGTAEENAALISALRDVVSAPRSASPAAANFALLRETHPDDA